jgi:predicted DNA-binding transcriptional regulator YafY
MRADRLLAILLLLQRGGRMTAPELARRLEVSERTIYRDVEALSAAGVPVYAEAGRNGGIRLVEGYRTDLSGLSLDEAELLPLLGLAQAFGGHAALRRAESKVLMALPEEQRKRAELTRRRIHVELPRWWESAEPVPYLPAIVDAVLAGRRLRIGYQRGADEADVRRTVDPYGLVLQGGTWYLVARSGAGEPRTYRVSRVTSAVALDETVTVPRSFDVAAFWSARKEDFHLTNPRYKVTVRATAEALRRLRFTHGTHHPVPDDPPEWTTIELFYTSEAQALTRLLALGPEIEVVGPATLRRAMRAAASRMAALYRSG